MMKKLTTILLLLALFKISFSQGHPTIQSIVDETNLDSLLFSVAELSGEVSTIINGAPYTITSRHKFSDGNAKAAVYLKQRLERYGLTSFYQNFDALGINVLAEKIGTEFPNQKFIICGHYDSQPSGSTAPGADDNGSGTAAVIEAARIFQNYSFPYTIVFALWDEEEQGLIGAEHYSDVAAAAGDSILGVVNMDMIAWDENDDGVVRVHTRNINESMAISDKMVELNTIHNIGLTTIIENPGTGASDHAAFWSNNYSAILLIEDDVSDFNNYYHTINDLMIHFNQPYFRKCAQLGIATTAALAMNLNIVIDHIPFASVDYSSDIMLTANIASGLTIGAGTSGPRLFYRTDSGSGFSDFIEVEGLPVDNSGIYNFTIPAQSLGTKVQYYLAAQDSASTIVTTLPNGGNGFNPAGNIAPLNVYQFYVAPIDLVFDDNAVSMANWQASGNWNTTTSKYVSSPSSFTDSPGGNYSNNQTVTLTTLDFITLGDAIGSVLKFQTQWNIESDWDYGQLQISTDGTSWQALQGIYTEPGTGTFQPTGEPVYDGAQATWVEEEIDLTPFVGQQIKLRFLLKSDVSLTEDGWYIDDIVIENYGIVPVELTSFTYQTNDNNVVLTWQTATELNNQGFEVHKSIDKENWQLISFIDGHGTSSNPNSYSFSHEPKQFGQLYYRLKQLDFDGTFKIYGPIEVEFTGSMDYALEQNYPNPFNPTTKIRFSIPKEENVKIVITNSLGQQVAELLNSKLEAGRHELEFKANGYSSGVYFYQIQAGEYSEVRKMMLLK
jgi:hypothetical protein